MERGSGRRRRPSVPLKKSWRSLSTAAVLSALFLVCILGVSAAAVAVAAPAASPAADGGPAYGALAPSADNGTITVNSTPDGAPFSIEGPENYGGEAPHTFYEAPAGEYSISWGEVAGYTRPASQTRTLAAGGTITFNGVYEVEEPPPPQTGTIVVTASVAGATFSITGAETYSGAPRTIGNAPAGEYTISWGEVAGYTRPASQTRTLAAGGTITFAGSYGSDTAGPRVSGVMSTGITASGATITWTTDEPADGRVQYGPTAGYGSTTPANANLTTSHSVALAGLVFGTVYHYRVISADALGNSTTSGDYTFTTIDNMPPAATGVTVTDITPTSCNITWTTAEKADSQVEYGSDVTYGFLTTPDKAMVTSHRVALTGLSPGTWYSCRVLSRDATGNLAQSDRYEFLTSDDTPPAISGVTVIDISASSVTITWVTDERADSQVEYGLTANYGSSSTVDSALVYDHLVVLTGLAPQTTYHYRVKSTDYWANSTRSPGAAVPTTDVDAPVISAVMATHITDSSATITWVTDSMSEGSVEYGISATYGSVSTYDNSMVISHSTSLSALSAQTLYHFKVKSRDASGLWAESADCTFTTGVDMGPDPPQIQYLQSASLTSSGITIYWNTNEPATAMVEYGLTKECGSSSAADGQMATSHTVSLTGLKAGTTYYYRAVSMDAAGNRSASEDRTFSTPIGRAPLPSLPAWAWALVGSAGALLVGVLAVKNR